MLHRVVGAPKLIIRDELNESRFEQNHLLVVGATMALVGVYAIGAPWSLKVRLFTSPIS